MATTAEKLDEGVDAAVLDWRVTALTRAGYLPEQALRLVVSREVDLHLAERLVLQGCPPATAVRILL
jgi:hypothetical protein